MSCKRSVILLSVKKEILLFLYIKDPCYQNTVLQSVRDLLEVVLIGFQLTSTYLNPSPTNLFELSLDPNVLNSEDGLHIKREASCIGLSISSLLSDIYMNTLDRALNDCRNCLETGASWHVDKSKLDWCSRWITYAG